VKILGLVFEKSTNLNDNLSNYTHLYANLPYSSDQRECINPEFDQTIYLSLRNYYTTETSEMIFPQIRNLENSYIILQVDGLLDLKTIRQINIPENSSMILLYRNQSYIRETQGKGKRRRKKVVRYQNRVERAVKRTKQNILINPTEYPNKDCINNLN
jgi:hypothetical protein